MLARQFLVGTGLLIALYLGLAYATNGGKLLGSGASAYVSGVRVLQGR
jgi:hypothetical protein